MEISFFVTG